MIGQSSRPCDWYRVDTVSSLHPLWDQVGCYANTVTHTPAPVRHWCLRARILFGWSKSRSWRVSGRSICWCTHLHRFRAVECAHRTRCRPARERQWRRSDGSCAVTLVTWWHERLPRYPRITTFTMSTSRTRSSLECVWCHLLQAWMDGSIPSKRLRRQISETCEVEAEWAIEQELRDVGETTADE